MKRVCVFAGSNPGKREIYQEEAIKLGKELVTHGLGLVYGGGNAGLLKSGTYLAKMHRLHVTIATRQPLD